MRKLLLLVAFAVLFSGCATPGPSGPAIPLASNTQDALAKQFVRDNEKGTVYIYMTRFDSDLSLRYPVYIDNRNFGSLVSGTYTVVKLIPGSYQVVFKNSQYSKYVDVEKGSMHFLKWSVGFFEGAGCFCPNRQIGLFQNFLI